jgi:thiamine biosynthesis lipoprotein
MPVTRRGLLSLSRPHSPAPGGGFWLHVARRAMACKFEITLPSELSEQLDAATAALDTVDEIEDALTIFRSSSEIARINRDAFERPVTVDQPLFDLLWLCRTLHDETGGAFDITSTPLSRVWGFLKRQGRRPTDDELAEARASVGMQQVALDPQARTVRFLRPGMSLNLGAIGKGYALDRVCAQLRRAGVLTALLTGGASSIQALGSGPDERGFKVGIRDPAAHERRVGTLRLSSQALGVSGSGEQFFEENGKRYGHIIDPRSGWPVEGRALVAVAAPSAALADALATAFFVGGRAVTEAYLQRHPDVSALLIDMSLTGTNRRAIVLGEALEWDIQNAA